MQIRERSYELIFSCNGDHDDEKMENRNQLIFVILVCCTLVSAAARVSITKYSINQPAAIKLTAARDVPNTIEKPYLIDNFKTYLKILNRQSSDNPGNIQKPDVPGISPAPIMPAYLVPLLPPLKSEHPMKIMILISPNRRQLILHWHGSRALNSPFPSQHPCNELMPPGTRLQRIPAGSSMSMDRTRNMPVKYPRDTLA